MKLDPESYQNSPEELRELVLRNSLLLAFKDGIIRKISREFNQRERKTSSYTTHEETLIRIRALWKKAEESKKEVVILFEKRGKKE